MIEDTKATDNGNYDCMAQNDAGEARSGPARLVVLPESNSITGKDQSEISFSQLLVGPNSKPNLDDLDISLARLGVARLGVGSWGLTYC